MQAIASEQRCRKPITVSAGHRDAKRHSEQTSDQISGTDIGAMIAQTDSASPSSTAITNYTKENPMTHAAATHCARAKQFATWSASPARNPRCADALKQGT